MQRKAQSIKFSGAGSRCKVVPLYISQSAARLDVWYDDCCGRINCLFEVVHSLGCTLQVSSTDYHDWLCGDVCLSVRRGRQWTLNPFISIDRLGFPIRIVIIDRGEGVEIQMKEIESTARSSAAYRDLSRLIFDLSLKRFIKLILLTTSGGAPCNDNSDCCPFWVRV